MASSFFPLLFEKGSDFSLDLTWLPDNQTPADLTGFNAKFEVFQDPNYYTPVVIASTLGDGTTGTSLVLGGNTGTVAVTVGVTALALLTDDVRTVYSLTLESSGGQFTKLFGGIVALKPLTVEW